MYVQKIAHALQETGNNVRVATRFATKRPDDGMRRLLTESRAGIRRCDNGIPVTELAAGWKRFALKPVFRLQARRLTQSLAKICFNIAYSGPLKEALGDCDVIHYSGTGREMTGFVALNLARERNIPFVVTPHTHAGSWGDAPIDVSLYRQADAVIALTAFEKSHLAGLGVPQSRIHVVGHGVTVEGTGEASRGRQMINNHSGPFILYLGRKATYKGFGRTLEAAPEVWKRHPDAMFVFAGPDSDDTSEIREEHQAVLNDERVVELGFISEQEKEDLLAACDIFCLPSEAEAYGLVYLEAWAYQTPVVAYAIPTVTELVNAGAGGVLVREGDQTTAEAIASLLANRERRQALGNHGNRWVQAQTWHRVAQKLETIYVSNTGVPLQRNIGASTK